MNIKVKDVDVINDSTDQSNVKNSVKIGGTAISTNQSYIS